MGRPSSVSVVVVNWNAGDDLLACLRSLAEHPPSCEWDAVVVDNASTDGSAEEAGDTFPWLKLIVNETNRGLAAANNQGIAATAGDAILICNPDVVFLDGSIDALIDVLARHPRAAFAIPRLLHPDGRLQTGAGDLPTIAEALRGRASARARAADATSRAFWWDGWAHDEERRIGHGAEAAYLVRRRALDEIGLQDEGFWLDWEGIDWAARVAAAGWEIWFTPDAEIVHTGGVSIRQATVRWVLTTHRGMARYLRKHHGLAGLMVQPVVAVRAIVKLLGSRLVPFYDRAQDGIAPAQDT